MEYELPEETKRCPYCAEIIQTAAIKCRYCGEFLDRPVRRPQEFPELKNAETETEAEQKDNTILFEARPSMWASLPALCKAAIVIAAAGFAAFWPIRQILEDYKTAENLITMIERYRILAGIGIAVIALLVVLFKIIKLKSVHYEVTADRVEWSRGIFDRRVDNIDMFRVVDLRLRRNIFDCIVGIGSVVLITNDRTDPEFEFEKTHRSRMLYDIIKKASLDADTKRGVIHLE